MIWVLIVIGVYSGGFGFSQEFANQGRCEFAKHTIQKALGKSPALAYCVPKE